jgi:hypothetical protein
MAVNFARIYATDLMFVPGCWKLCGDGHCCSFRRYKVRFKLIGSPPVLQLPILPGEYAWLRESGLLEKVRGHEHRVKTHEFNGRRLHMETMVAKEPTCFCAHETRTTVCRLYPLLPLFDDDGHLTGASSVFGSFELLEQLEGLERACKITHMSLGEADKFAIIAGEIARDPVALYYARAYAMTLDQVRRRLPELHAARGDSSYFATFEMSLIRGRLLDQEVLDRELTAMAERFERRYGSAFSLQ